MELRQLEYFSSVAEYANFTRAAEELHVSQPAITTAIKNLEDELGFPLFIRQRKGVILTNEGEKFLDTTRHVFKTLDTTVKEIREKLADRDDIINMGLAPVAGARLISEVYGEFSAKYPQIKTNLYEMGSYGLLNAIDTDQIDIAFMVLIDEIHGKYDYEVVEKDVIHVVVSKDSPLASFEKLTLDQIKDTPILSLPRHSYVGRRVEEAFSKAGIIPNIIAAPTQMITIFNLITHNVGISFVLGSGFAESVQMKNLAFVPLEPALSYQIGFVWKKNKHLTTASRKCIRYVRDSF